jgi:serine/threonine protein kinase
MVFGQTAPTAAAVDDDDDDDDDDGPVTTLAEIDQEFQQVGCLGHGGFGSVFLARKKSGRQVALKFARFELDNEDVDEEKSIWSRELNFVLKLEDSVRDNGNSRFLSIVFFEDWFTGPNYACIVMNYADGGTLAGEIASHSEDANAEPYTERRIAWYALQLSGALAFAHERSIVHHDVKSANVLIDRSGGGKLLLADWGSAVDLGEETIKFTACYAPPEMHAAVRIGNLAGLETDKIDAFGLGCILYEMLCCKTMGDLVPFEQGLHTLGEYIGQKSVNEALDRPCMRLPWLPETPTAHQTVGYSNALRGLVKTLLEPNPPQRWTPLELQKPFHQDPLNPLLAKYLIAAQTASPGAPLTIDNIQLGMFVQRGRDWNDRDNDGGLGSVGVVVKLDADAGYTEVTFPSRVPSVEPKPIICRIGAGNRFELQIGPTPFKDFVGQSETSRHNGVIECNNASQFSAGQMINSNCVVLSSQPDANCILVAPMEKVQIPALPVALPGPVAVRTSNPRQPLPPPRTWNLNLGRLVEVTDPDEKDLVIAPFFADRGGLDIQNCEIVSIQRVQLEQMWTAYASCRESVAGENWGVANEKRLFHGTGRQAPEELLMSPSDFYQKCTAGLSGGNPNEIRFSLESKAGDAYSYRHANLLRQMVVSRVALGRVDDRRPDQERPVRPPTFDPLDYHSVHEQGPTGLGYAIGNPFQAYPEFVVTYKMTANFPERRIVTARRSPRGARAPPRPTQQSSPTVAQAIPSSSVAARSPGTQCTTNPAGFSTPPPTYAQGNPKAPGSTASVAKECVVCLERNVTHILIPCGHPCLCEICATGQGLAKLRHKCPECRGRIREAVRFYGKIVEDH